jgi:hypothetical protein
MAITVLGIDLGKNSCSMLGWTGAVRLSCADVCIVRT